MGAGGGWLGFIVLWSLPTLTYWSGGIYEWSFSEKYFLVIKSWYSHSIHSRDGKLWDIAAHHGNAHRSRKWNWSIDHCCRCAPEGSAAHLPQLSRLCQAWLFLQKSGEGSTPEQCRKVKLSCSSQTTSLRHMLWEYLRSGCQLCLHTVPVVVVYQYWEGLVLILHC